MDLCKELKHLQSLVHVSTAYANCHLDHVEEKVYDMKISPDLMMKLTEELDSETLHVIADPVFEGRPNTYTFTKALAERYIRDNRGNMPVAIVRPSIVTAAWQGAAAGWIDNFNGPAGMVLLGTLGIARTMRINPSCTADVIPVDIVANALISIGWYTAKMQDPELKVYHVSTGTTNPITWYKYLTYSVEEAERTPSIKTVRPPPSLATGQGESEMSYFVSKWISEVMVGYIMDFLLILVGKKPMMIGIMKRMHRALEMFSFFCQRTWSFPADNLTNLMLYLRKTSPEDLDLFYINTHEINWRKYVGTSYMGIRRYLLKESDSTVGRARRRVKLLKLIYYTLYAALFVLFVYLFHSVYLNLIKSLADSAFLIGVRRAWASSSLHHAANITR
jgi:fatty acyl-CoA reductase